MKTVIVNSALIIITSLFVAWIGSIVFAGTPLKVRWMNDAAIKELKEDEHLYNECMKECEEYNAKARIKDNNSTTSCLCSRRILNMYSTYFWFDNSTVELGIREDGVVVWRPKKVGE